MHSDLKEFVACLEDYAQNKPSGFVSDIQRITELAARHKLGPVIAQQLGETAPPSLIAQVRKNNILLLQQAAALNAITAKCAQLDIAVRPVKGFASATLYRKPADRHFGDIDLLANTTEDVEALHLVLVELGFTSESSHVDIPAEMRSLHWQYQFADIYNSPNGLWQVEVHWLAPSRGKFITELADEANYRLVSAPGGTVQVPNAPLQFIYLCSHGSRSAWRRLKWLLDIRLLADSLTMSDWQAVEKLAADNGQRRHLDITLLLLGELFGFQSPLTVDAKRYQFALKFCRQCINGPVLGQSKVNSFKYFWKLDNRWVWRKPLLGQVLMNHRDFTHPIWRPWMAYAMLPIVRPGSVFVRNVVKPLLPSRYSQVNKR